MVAAEVLANGRRTAPASIPDALRVDEETYMSAAQTAHLLGVPAKTVGNMGRDGRLPRVQVARRVVYPRRRILDLMAEAERTGLPVEVVYRRRLH